jgi:hypothetical protein
MLSFITFWFVGFSSTIFGARCLDQEVDVNIRKSSCNWASKTTLAKYFEADHSEYAAIEIERVITLAEVGSIEESELAMSNLLDWAAIDRSRPGITGNQRDDKVAGIILSRINKLDRNSNSFLVFSRALGFLQ